MGTILATALPFVPLIVRMSGTSLFEASELEMAQSVTASREIFPNSLKSYSPAAAERRNSHPAGNRFMESAAAARPTR